MRKIEIIPVYRIKGDNKKYRTYKAAVNRLAWILVFDKYGDQYIYHGDNDVEIYNKPHPFGLECICDPTFTGAYYDTQDGCEHFSWEYCPIHDRKTGYLRRLHNRLVRFIMFNYPMPRLAEDYG